MVAASFLLAWAAEAARLDIAGPLAIAILAVIAVLPEYAVDLYFAWSAARDPTYAQYAAANMTVTGITGGGLTWQLVRRTNVQRGDTEIWRAFAPTPLTNVTVTATLSQAVMSSISLVVS